MRDMDNHSMIPATISDHHWQALNFIVSTFEQYQIAYHITGGLAGTFYGSQWPVHDLDLEVSQKDIDQVAALFKPYTIRPLSRFVDEEFDLMLLTLRLHGVEVDINQVEDSFVFHQGKRIKLNTNLDAAHCFKVGELKLRVQPLDAIIAYKELLNRNPDIADLKQLRSS